MFGPPQSFCLCCENYSEYLQATSLIDRLNASNNKYPIEYDLVSGSSNPESMFEKRWLEINCEKPVRIKHFIDELEEEVKFMHKLAEQNPEFAPKAKSPELPVFKKRGKKEPSKQQTKNISTSEYSSLTDLANFLFQFEEQHFSRDDDED